MYFGWNFYFSVYCLYMFVWNFKNFLQFLSVLVLDIENRKFNFVVKKNKIMINVIKKLKEDRLKQLKVFNYFMVIEFMFYIK